MRIFSTHNKNCKISDIIKDIGMTTLITDPTHFTKNSESILDMLIVNDSENINFFGLGRVYFLAPHATTFLYIVF